MFTCSIVLLRYDNLRFYSFSLSILIMTRTDLGIRKNKTVGFIPAHNKENVLSNFLEIV